MALRNCYVENNLEKASLVVTWQCANIATHGNTYNVVLTHLHRLRYLHCLVFHSCGQHFENEKQIINERAAHRSFALIEISFFHVQRICTLISVIMNYTIVLQILVLKLRRKCKKDKTIFFTNFRQIWFSCNTYMKFFFIWLINIDKQPISCILTMLFDWGQLLRYNVVEMEHAV